MDLRILELDLRFRGGLGLSPPLKFSSPIVLRPSPPLNLKSHCKPSDFGFFRWFWAPKSIIGAGDLDAENVLLLKMPITALFHIFPWVLFFILVVWLLWMSGRLLSRSGTIPGLLTLISSGSKTKWQTQHFIFGRSHLNIDITTNNRYLLRECYFWYNKGEGKEEE